MYVTVYLDTTVIGARIMIVTERSTHRHQCVTQMEVVSLQIIVYASLDTLVHNVKLGTAGIPYTTAAMFALVMEHAQHQIRALAKLGMLDSSATFMDVTALHLMRLEFVLEMELVWHLIYVTVMRDIMVTYVNIMIAMVLITRHRQYALLMEAVSLLATVYANLASTVQRAKHGTVSTLYLIRVLFALRMEAASRRILAHAKQDIMVHVAKHGIVTVLCSIIPTYAQRMVLAWHLIRVIAKLDFTVTYVSIMTAMERTIKLQLYVLLMEVA